MADISTVDHIGIAVASISDALPLFHDSLGGVFLSGGDNDDSGIRLLHLKLPGFKIELMQPLREDCVLQSYLDRHGPGFHHMTFFVDDLRSTLRAFSDEGVATTGANLQSGRWADAFVHPRASFGALLQFVQTNLRWDQPIEGITLEDVLAGRVMWHDHVPCLRATGVAGVE